MINRRRLLLVYDKGTEDANCFVMLMLMLPMLYTYKIKWNKIIPDLEESVDGRHGSLVGFISVAVCHLENTGCELKQA